MQTQEAIKTFLLKKKSNTKLDIFLFLSEHRFFITTQYLAGECKIFCVNEKIHTKKEVASVE
ncbi:hypothetical protein HQ949_08750 [Enterococcus faecium]|nr:hypothetical protein [Enterococcus faecium]